MNLADAFTQVDALLRSSDAGEHFLSGAEADAIRVVRDELRRIRERAQALNLTNLLAEHRGLEGLPPPPDTERLLPEETS